MHTFLAHAATQIIDSKRGFDTLKIIVPSNRAILFLKEALKAKLNRPHLAPEICSIENFIEELSGLKKRDSAALLLQFYDIYSQNVAPKKQESFDQYLGWGEVILHEFNEMDANLVETNALFKALEDYRALESWTAESLSQQDLLKHFLHFNKLLPTLYKKLYRALLEEEQGYTGMRYREAVANIEHYFQAHDKHHYFIGFNALNKAEEFLFQEFLAQQQATIIWDIDATFYEDGEHPAGHFIRQYFNTWPVLKKEKPPQWETTFKEEKSIELVGLPKNIAQAQYAAQILAQPANGSTALVLGEESLLRPTLSALDPNTSEWNVTMGLPLEQTAAATFFGSFMKLHENSNSDQLDFYQLQNLLATAQCQSLLEVHQIEMRGLMQTFRKQKQFQIAYREIEKAIATSHPLLSLLFAPFTTVSEFIVRAADISVLFAAYWKKLGDDRLEASCFEKMHDLFNALQPLVASYPFVTTMATLRLFYDKLLQQHKISFAGNPLEGLQIMGLLETRLLDFETLIITNVNEGILPAGKATFSWIPFSVKKQFGMPTFIEQDYLYSYHFFRLLQRAKKIYLLYNATPEGLYGGEKSRFLYQLEYLKMPQHKLQKKQPQIAVKWQPVQRTPVAKTPEILTQLNQLAKSGFSPSSLTTFWRDSYQFYERYILKIEPQQPIEKTLQANEKGTLMHAVLETLYAPFVQQELRVENYDPLIKNVAPLLLEHFQQEFGSAYQIKGKNFLLFESMKKLLEHFLKEEQKAVAEGQVLKILALEKEVSGEIAIANSQTKIKLKGHVDRIDQCDGVLRIVDYKTGTVTPSSLEIASWSSLLEDPKKSPLFQVLLYGYMLPPEWKDHIVCAGIIPFKTFSNRFLPAQLGKGNQKKWIGFSTAELQEFESQLASLLFSLFDSKTPFGESQ